MTNLQAIDLLKGLEQSLDDYCELNDEGKTAFRMAITALEVFGLSEQLPSAQPEQSESEDITFWKKRAREYEEMVLKLTDEMARGIKIDSVLITEEGIVFKKEKPEQRWIPCEERLPEEGQLVLTTIRGTDVIRVEDGETFEDAIDRSRKIVRVSVGFIGSDGWYGVDGYPEIVTPCAWKPLPEPWKEGETDGER